MDAKTALVVAGATLLAGAGCGARGGGGTMPEAIGTSDRDLLAWLDAGARSGATTDVLHGRAVPDPYRLLETDHPVTRAWIEAQSARTERALARHATPERARRIGALMSIGVLSGPRLAGDRVVYQRRAGDAEQPVLMVRDAGGAGEPRLLLDPAAAGPRVAIDWYYPSPGGSFVAVGLSQNGDERSVLRVLDAATGTEPRPAERIERCKWSTVSWLADESGFYYTRYPREGEPGFDAAEPDAYFPRVFFHRLGTDPAADPLVYGAEAPEDFPSPSVSDDDRWLVINVAHGWSRGDVLLVDRAAPEPRPVPVSVGCDCLIAGTVRGGTLWLHTNEGHPRYRLLAVEPERAADRAAWREVVPETEATLEGFGVAADRLVLYELRDFSARLRVTTHAGEPAGELALPTAGDLEGLTVQPTSNRVAFVFGSFFHPPTLYVGDVATLDAAVLERVETDFDVAAYEVSRAAVPSADGTPVNVFLVHRRGAPRDGTNRVLLYGYGGFNVSLLPSFSRRALFWLEQGGVYAVANLRGGGELGEEWHRAGQLEHRHRVFEDFEGVVRWLSTSGWSAPDRIAILGGSNGGLLVGATLNRCPEAFAAAVGYVGLYDMVRYHRFPPAELWVSEYGSAEDAAQLGYLLEYSPYHNVRDGAAYPATLIETADHDSRVHWGHSTKHAARLQAASSRPEDVLFFMDRSVGHGAGTGRSDAIDQTVRMYAFLMWRLFGEGGAEP
jgi:prolyl oligopeptidase